MSTVLFRRKACSSDEEYMDKLVAAAVPHAGKTAKALLFLTTAEYLQKRNEPWLSNQAKEFAEREMMQFSTTCKLCTGTTESQLPSE